MFDEESFSNWAFELFAGATPWPIAWSRRPGSAERAVLWTAGELRRATTCEWSRDATGAWRREKTAAAVFSPSAN